MERSYLSAVFSMLVFGTVGILRRYIPLPSGVVSLVRGLLGGLFLLLLLKIRKKNVVKAGGKSLVLLIVTGALIGLNWVFLFESYNYTSVQVATLAYYMEPSIVILLSPLFLNEKLNLKKVLCVISSVIGMMMVSGVMDGDSLTSNDTSGIIYGLLAAALYASVVILNKKISGYDSAYKTMIQLFAASLTVIPYILFKENIRDIELSPLSVSLLLVLGIFHTGFAYSLYFGSMERLSAQSTAVISYIDPVSALILSSIILHEHLTLWGIIGSVMIIVSSLLSEIKLPGKKQ